MLDFRHFLPDVVVLVLLFVSFLAWRLPLLRSKVGPLVLYGLVAAAGVQLATLLAEQSGAAQVANLLSFDGFAGFARLLVLLSGAGVAAIAPAHLQEHPRLARFYSWLLLATSGALLLPAAMDWAVVALGVEGLAIGTSLLIGWSRSPEAAPESRMRAEAALKSYLPSAVATILLLFGISWLYGLTGTTSLAETGGKLLDLGTTTNGPMLLATLLILGGLSGKALLVPFQGWVMEAAEGGSLPALAFATTVPMVAGFALLARVLPGALTMARDLWAPALVLMSLGTMIIGSLFAIAQTQLTRILAAAAIAQSGVLALALLACAHPDAAADARAALLVALAANVVATLGACAVLVAIAEGTGQTALAAFRGLGRRNPWLVGVLAVCLLGLCGLPPVAGFWGKVAIFRSVIAYATASQAFALVWLVVVASLQTALAAYYYMRAPRLALAEAEPAVPTFGVSAGSIAVAAAAVVALFALFLFPSSVWHVAAKAAAGL